MRIRWGDLCVVRGRGTTLQCAWEQFDVLGGKSGTLSPQPRMRWRKERRPSVVLCGALHWWETRVIHLCCVQALPCDNGQNFAASQVGQGEEGQAQQSR